MTDKTTRVCKQDAIIGIKIKELRLNRCIHAKTLAKHLGISIQQLNKYENAKNRISASSLCKIAEYLQLPIASFCNMNENEFKQNNNINELTRIALINAVNNISPASQQYLTKFVKALNEPSSIQE